LELEKGLFLSGRGGARKQAAEGEYERIPDTTGERGKNLKKRKRITEAEGERFEKSRG